MKIKKAGKYLIKTHTCKKYEIEITERNGALGAWLPTIFSFVPVSQFKGAEVICRLDK